jgi:fructosamine-3-kinase
VPEVYEVGSDADNAWIELERLALVTPDTNCEVRFGAQLAALHRHTASRHGWRRDNTIGASPQKNREESDWLTFWREQRLGVQLDLAAGNGYGGELQERGAALMERHARLLHDYDPLPALRPGGRGGGNRGMVDGHPLILDPAGYYGDRETDLAMTRLFGGFGRAFYRAYDEAWPLARGWEQRVPLYQLYHVLNHLNLFGSGYESRALQLLRQLT